jgi:hypothetical protein
MYLGKAGACPTGEQLKCTSPGLAPGLSYKHWTRLERPDRDKQYLIDWKGLSGTNTLSYRLARPARDKHSSLLEKFAIYGLKKFYNNGPKPQQYLFENLRKSVVILIFVKCKGSL